MASFWSNRNRKNVNFLFNFIIIIWIIELANFFLNHYLCEFGVVPRTVIGLRGIVFMPFLHYGFQHLLLNTIPLFVLGFLASSQNDKLFVKATILIVLLSGLCVWVFARPSVHVGASGLVFGYFGYIVSQGLYGKKLSSMIIALVTIFLYGGILWGILPTSPHISWEGHLAGVICGFVVGKKV